MTAKQKTRARRCSNCGAASAHEIKRDEIYGQGPTAVIIENVPMIHCYRCGMTYLEPAVIQTIDEICAHPEQHTHAEYRPIAKLA